MRTIENFNYYYLYLIAFELKIFYFLKNYFEFNVKYLRANRVFIFIVLNRNCFSLHLWQALASFSQCRTVFIIYSALLLRIPVLLPFILLLSYYFILATSEKDFQLNFNAPLWPLQAKIALIVYRLSVVCVHVHQFFGNFRFSPSWNSRKQGFWSDELALDSFILKISVWIYVLCFKLTGKILKWLQINL